jgi:hypothetical protein
MLKTNMNRNICSVKWVHYVGWRKCTNACKYVGGATNSLSSACYVIRSLRAVVSKNTLRMIHFSYVHSIITYGMIFWGNMPNGIKIFKKQKKIIRIMTNSGTMDSCRALFKRMKILPLYSQYIYIHYCYI